MECNSTIKSGSSQNIIAKNNSYSVSCCNGRFNYNRSCISTTSKCNKHKITSSNTRECKNNLSCSISSSSKSTSGDCPSHLGDCGSLRCIVTRRTSCGIVKSKSPSSPYSNICSIYCGDITCSCS